ncbi:MAG: ribonuclease Z [Deltaproteobacteria bacterium]|nr:ribonuclease Z [Deltaproteobacteria bacterium]
MQIHFLGTTGWFTTAMGETPSILIDAAEAYVILDAGQSLRKVPPLITTEKPIYLFLSHFHLDHTYGFHTLPLFHSPQGLTIYGQPGTERLLHTLIARPWTCPIERLKIPVRIQDIDAGTYDAPIPFTCTALVHTDPCFGYRLTLEGKTVAYCTDTGVCAGLHTLATKADLLITECTWQHPNERPDWPHLAPEDAATAARDAGARALALIHFDANNYRTRGDRTDAETRAKAIFPNTRAMHDDEVILL